MNPFRHVEHPGRLIVVDDVFEGVRDEVAHVLRGMDAESA